jgi:hypothetical protein
MTGPESRCPHASLGPCAYGRPRGGAGTVAWASPTGLGVQLAASRRRGELAQAARASLACYARHGAVARAGCPQREVVPLGQLQRRTVPVTVPSCSSESATGSPSRTTPDSPELAGRRRRSRRLRPRARDSESGLPPPARPCQRRPPAARPAGAHRAAAPGRTERSPLRMSRPRHY